MSLSTHYLCTCFSILSNFHFHSEFLEDMKESPDPRVVMVGSVTGNDNTVGGGGVYPIADLKDLSGFKAGFDNPIAMADGKPFFLVFKGKGLTYTFSH